MIYQIKLDSMGLTHPYYVSFPFPLGVTILLGLDLFQTDKVVIIVWFAVCVAFIIIMEIGLMVIAKYNFSGMLHCYMICL